ncbi:hypothetical protein IQE94_04040 [Synechocystis sp. PCC 7339]|uniref:hypothetical protein n=1 Tax=unclassified Synechocystis TaxID=2640012 RepID=UPI001BAF36EE|nr:MULTISPECIES: hypothetical protein [unclassified Synechocystis]QUS62410.1 hypothetical protein HTZ78_11960 [Synechocystis sp. PCC 7338]UAJ74360.1 hypothetical protein IQE94_04040 [Synechocystis sp. PCC 7339]
MPMSSLISLFRQHYPQGSLCCDLLEIDRGLYIVQASITLEGIVVATALAAQCPLEAAEDLAKERAIASLDLPHGSPTEFTPKADKSDKIVTDSGPAKQSSQASPSKKETKPSKQSGKAVISSPPTKATPAPVVEKSPVVEVIAAPAQTATSVSVSFPPSPDPVLPLEEPVLTQAMANNSLDQLDELPFANPELQLDLATGRSPETPELPLPIETEPEPSEPAMANAGATDLPEGPMDFSEIIARSNLELKRLGWTSEQGRNYLLQTYGKRSRQLLSDEQLIEFLAYLEQQPTP